MTHVVILQYGADVAIYRKGFHGNIHHQREALIQNLPQVGEETPIHGVKAHQYGYLRVQKVHSSVLVNADKSEPRKPGDRVNPIGEVTKEGVNPPAGAPFCL